MSDATTGRVWMITGASTGFGRALAQAVLASGQRLVATDLDRAALAGLPGGTDQLARLALDVTDPGEIAAATDDALAKFGAVDVLVNNAGFGLLGAVEEVDEQQLRRQMEVNFFGAVAVTRALLPSMRARGRGHIIQISSYGGIVANPGLGFYSASKFALEGVSEALAKELEPLGIRVTLVEPGAFRTNWAGRSLNKAKPIDDYEPTVGKMRALIDRLDGNQPGDPAKAAAAMLALGDDPDPPLRLPLGDDSVGFIRDKLRAQLAELDRLEPQASGLGYA